MERLESIPKSIDNSNLVLKNFEKVLVGSIETKLDGAGVKDESSNISSPKIITVSNKRKIISAKREREQTILLEGTRLSSVQRTILPGMTTNNKLHTKKRSLTRKTAIITPFPTSPLSLRNARDEVTYPKNSSIQVSEVSGPSSPRRKVRKTRILSPASSAIILDPIIKKPHENNDPSFPGVKNQERSPTFSSAALMPSKSSIQPIKDMDIDSKIQSFLGLSGTSVEASSLHSSAKVNSKKLEEEEKILEQKRKFALELLEKQMRPVIPVTKRAIKPIIKNDKENEIVVVNTEKGKSPFSSTAKAVEDPIVHPKPIPDPRKSEEARKYMKEKKLQEMKKKKLFKEEEEKKKELIASRLKKLDDERRMQRQEDILKKSKQLAEEAAKYAKKTPDLSNKIEPLKSSEVAIQAKLSLTEVPSLLIQENPVEVVTLATVPPIPLAESQKLSHLGSMLALTENHPSLSKLNEKSVPSLKDLAKKTLKYLENTPAKNSLLASANSEIKHRPMDDSPLASIPNSANLLENNQISEELAAKLDSLAQGVIAIGEKIRKLEQTNLERHNNKEAEIKASEESKKIAHENISLKDSNLPTSKIEDKVGVGSLAEFSKKRKDFVRNNDAALVIQTFYKKQKRKGSMPTQKLNANISNGKGCKINQEPQLMDVFAESNRKPQSPSRLFLGLPNKSSQAAENIVDSTAIPAKLEISTSKIGNNNYIQKQASLQNEKTLKKKHPEDSKMMTIFAAANQRPQSPIKSKAALFAEIVASRKDEDLIISKAPENSLGIVEESLLMDMLESNNKKPQSSALFSAFSSNPTVQAPDIKDEVKRPFHASIPREKFSIVDLFVKKLSKTGICIDSQENSVLPTKKPSVKSLIEITTETHVIGEPYVEKKVHKDPPSDAKSISIPHTDFYSISNAKTVSKEIQTDMDISDVSELSEPLVTRISSINRTNVINPPVAEQEEKVTLLADVQTDDYYNDTFESISSSNISFRKPISPPPIKASIKRAKPLVGEALRRDLMGLDGQGKLAPESLGQRHDYELNCLEAASEYIIQADELRMNRESALWKQESAAILQLFISDQKTREVELEAARLQKLNTMANTNHYTDYDSSFESFTENHSLPKIINQKMSSMKPTIIEEEALPNRSRKAIDKELSSKKGKYSKNEKSSIRQLLDAVVETIPTSVKKALPPVLQSSKQTPPVSLNDGDFSFKLKMVKSDMESALKSKDLEKQVKYESKVSHESEESISEDIPMSIQSSIHSSISEHLPSDISQSQRVKGKDETGLYEDESFYSADSNLESAVSSTTPTDMTDLLTVDELLKNATKKLNSKMLSKKEKSLKSISENYEKLKENAEWNQRLKLEGLRISKLISDLMKDPSSAPTANVENVTATLKEDIENDIKLIEKAKQNIYQEKSLNALSLQVAKLQEELNLHQENIMYFGQPDSPKKKPSQVITRHSASEPIVIPESPSENIKATNEPDEMSAMIIKLADQVLKMQADIDAKKAFVDSAKRLEKDIMIQKQLKIISGLSQEMLYLNQSERLIDPEILELVKSSASKNDNAMTADPVEYPKIVQPSVEFAAGSDGRLPVADTQPLKMNESPPLSTIKVEAIENIVVAEETQSSLRKDSKSAQSVTSESKTTTESRSTFQSKGTEAEDTTSDLVSEKLSELEIISENILSKTSESAGSDKSYQYEDDFESDEESSSKLPILPGSPSGSKSLATDSPEYLNMMTDAIFNELLENTFNSTYTTIKTSSKPKIVIPRLDVNLKPESEVDNKPVEPVWTFSNDLEQGVNILCRELDHIFQANAKFDEPPLIPMAELEGILPAAVAPLLLDCLESAINSQFQKHEAYNNPIRPLYEKKLIKPAPISSEKLVSIAKKRLFEWIQYPKTYGTNIDLFLAEIVKDEGKSYCEIQQDLVHVKLEMVDSIFNDLINDTVNCLLNVSI